MKIKTIPIYLAIFAAFPAMACEAPALVPKETYGVVNKERYRELEEVLKNRDVNQLKAMLDGKLVAKIDPGTKVCIEGSSFFEYLTQVSAPAWQLRYWVPDRAVEKVD